MTIETHDRSRGGDSKAMKDDCTSESKHHYWRDCKPEEDKPQMQICTNCSIRRTKPLAETKTVQPKGYVPLKLFR